MKLTILTIALALGAGSAANAANILLVTNNNTTTQSLNDFLTTSGHTVTRDARLTGPAAGDATTFDLVLVARETNSGNYDEGTEPQDWNALTIPLVMMAPHIMRDNRWGWITNTGIPLQTGVDSWDSGTAFSTATSSFNTIANTLVAGATISETINGTPSVFFIPSGTVMDNSRGTAGADRYGILVGAEAHWDNATAANEALLTSTIEAALVPEPSSAILALLSLGTLALRRRR